MSMSRQRVSDTWEQGPAYERYVGRWSRDVAPRFLEWLRVPAERRWLDVGCGTGALSTAILEQCAPASVDGVEGGVVERHGRSIREVEGDAIAELVDRRLEEPLRRFDAVNGCRCALLLSLIHI